MKYAIVSFSGKQYVMEEGKSVLVEKTNGEKDDKITFTDICLLRDGEDIVVGKPFVNGVIIHGTVLDQIKGEKLHVSRYKAKVRHRRSIGFRPKFTNVMIEKIVQTSTTSHKKEGTGVTKKKTA